MYLRGTAAELAKEARQHKAMTNGTNIFDGMIELIYNVVGRLAEYRAVPVSAAIDCGRKGLQCFI